MQIKKLSHVCLSTKSLKKVKDFYIGILKFKIAHEFINKNNKTYGYFINTGNKTFIEFFLSKNKIIKKNTPVRHICFEVYDIDTFFKKIKYKFPNSKLKVGKTDNIKQFFIKDYENNIIEFHGR